MDNSDSSDDENINLLKEAIDSSFIQDSMYSEKEKIQITEEKKILKSLRKRDEDDDQFKELKVTPEFRKHVAKHLERMLEEDLKKCLRNGSDFELLSTQLKRKRSGGVRLFSSSTNFLSACEYTDREAVRRHNKKCAKRSRNLTQKINNEDLKLVAIDADRILSRVDISCWAKKRTRGRVFTYKKCNDNLLHLVEPSE